MFVTRTVNLLAVVAMALSLVVVPSPSPVLADPVSDFDEAYGRWGGDWQRNDHNEIGLLAWGESYVMMGIAAMFRATGDPAYLDDLAYHADGVLENTDAARGVTDYRGESNLCWRNTSYQPNEEPYCWAVHTGMIAYPIAEFARLVRDAGLEATPAYDGSTFGAKAIAYQSALADVIAGHDDEFKPIGDAGAYFFQDDATFLGLAGQATPLNQGETMGRLLLTMWDLTGDAGYLDKGTRLVRRLHNALSTGPSGEYLWNYWGDPYAAPGEDISHAAISVGFASLAAGYGIVIDEEDMEAFGSTFMDSVYVDADRFRNNVGGGGINGSAYKTQSARWLMLTASRPSIYPAVLDYYAVTYPPSSIGSGSPLLGLAYLAEFEPAPCTDVAFVGSWTDDTGYWEPSGPDAAIEVHSPAAADPCLLSLSIDADEPVTIGQWDGAATQRSAEWPATTGWTDRSLAVDPELVASAGGVARFEVGAAGVRVDLPSTCQGLLVTVPGTSGDDTLTGTPGDDVIDGGAGNDTIDGLGGDDVICGGDGNDTLRGGDGADQLDGGDGADWVTFLGAAGGVTVDLWKGTVSGAAGDDTLTGIEHITGTGYADDLYGDATMNRINGLGGNDYIYSRVGHDIVAGGGGNDHVRGGPGNDVLDGGGGRDFVSYVWADAAVVVDLWSGEATGEGTDTLVSFEHAKGSAFADWLRGTGGDNRLWGYGGDDRLAGRAGDDWADGGGGSDVCLVETPINC